MADAECDVLFIPRTTTSSYEAVLSSRVSLTVDSALGYEALGLDEKIFFFIQGPTARRQVLQKYFSSANPISYSKLPAELKLMNESFEECDQKLINMLGMIEIENKNLSGDEKTYYMNND